VPALLDLLRAEPALWIAVCVAIALPIGSFLNVVILRLPRMMERDWAAQCAELAGQPAPAAERFNLAVPRSRCPSCLTTIRGVHNIPLLSWLWLRGRCASCGWAIPVRYPLVELATAAGAAAIGWHFGAGATAVLAFAFFAALLALAMIDVDTQLLPDSITLPLLWAGLVVNLWGVFAPLSDAVIGAVAGYLTLWSVYWAFRLATGREGMGYGDFKLLAAIGAWLGWQMLPIVVLLSSVAGALIGIGLIVAARMGREVPMPFGPYLAIAGVAALFWGQPLLDVWLGR